MSVSSIVAMGFGSFGGVEFVPTLGFTSGNAPLPPGSQNQFPIACGVWNETSVCQEVGSDSIDGFVLASEHSFCVRT